MIGSGDPTWGVVDLVSSRKPTDDLVGMLVDRGIHTVQGPISLVAADPRWDSYRAPVGWNGGTCSYSPALAFTIYRNCAGNRPVTDSRPIARQLLMASLQAAHIRIVSGPTSSGGTEDSAVYLSQPLSHILVPFLKHSINVVGEALLRTVGQKSETARNMDLLEAGQDEMREFVGRIGARTAGKVRVKVEPRYFSGRVTLYDGSGLSREDRVTGDAMIALLKDISNAPYFKYIWDALPIAGVDGTLKARMKGTAAQNLLRAKTGTISGVYNLAGYVPRMVNGRIAQLVPFVILTKDAKSKTAAHLIEDRLGRALAEAVLQTTIGPVR
jgi:D-alanyl-D-alanine carboxypeptidase